MSLKRQFAGATIGASMALSFGTVATANDNSENFINSAPVSGEYSVDIGAERPNDPFTSYDADRVILDGIQLADIQEPDLPQDFLDDLTVAQNLRLFHEIGSLVFQGAYVELSGDEITARYWAAIEDDYIARIGMDPDVAPSNLNDFFTALERIYNEVIIADELDMSEFTTGVIREFLADLDAHSIYTPPVNFAERQEQSRGSFGGLGFSVQQDEDTGYVRVMDFINAIGGSPAEGAGVLVDDMITHIDGVDISDMELEDIIELMRGRPGSNVDLTILREGEAETLDIEVRRAVIRISPVDSAVLADGEVGYVSLRSFTGQAALSIRQQIAEMEASDNPPSSYILDLRYNGGGLLREAIAISDDFLEAGAIVSERTRNGVRGFPEATPGDIINGKPLVVLINGFSASASEIVSGVLQHYDRATIIGTTSFGKGSVQLVMPLQSNGGGLNLTTGLYFIGGTQSIQNRGVEPDINVTFGVAELLEEIRVTEAEQRATILDEITEDQIIDDDDYQCVLPAHLSESEVLAELEREYIRTHVESGDQAIDATLLCAVEHLLGVERFTDRELEPGAPAPAAPTVTAPALRPAP